MEKAIAGADRLTALTKIANASKTGRTNLTILNAPPGSGRTFLLEQAYRVFAATHNTTHPYWPGELTPGQLAPTDFTPPEGSALEQLWLAISGDQTTLPMHRLADQLEAHAHVLRRTLELKQRKLPRLTSWAAQATGLTISGASLTTPGMTAVGAAAALFSLALAVDATTRSGADALQDTTIETATRFNTGWTVNPDEAHELNATVTSLAEGLTLVSQQIPIQLAIDDAETLDDQTASLIAKLLDTPGNITIIIATNMKATTEPWKTWLRNQTANEDTCQTINLKPLPDQDIEVPPGSWRHQL